LPLGCFAARRCIVKPVSSSIVMTTLDSAPGLRFGSVNLAPGVRPRHVRSLLLSTLIAFSLTAFVNVVQPYILTENLQLPSGVQGRISGDLVVMQETIALLLVGVLGSWSDRVGRRLVLAGGTAVISCGLFLYPLCRTLPELVLSRFVIALGAACLAATVAGLAADYPRNDSRGRLLSILLFTQAIGVIVLVANLGAKLPRLLQHAGYSVIAAGYAAFWLAGLVGLLGTLLAARGLRATESLPTNSTDRGSLRSRWIAVVDDLRIVLREARRNPRLALVFLMAVIARGDATIATAFLSLWIVTGARQQGISTAASLARTGTALTVFMVSALAATLCWGFVVDRLNRARAAMYAALAAGICYISSTFIGNVMDFRMLVWVAFLGATESAVIIAGQALLGEQASPRHRGSTVGVFGISGSLGVLFITAVGGRLFDHWTLAGPFVAVGAINLLVFGWAGVARTRMGVSRVC
jgi:MFS family permease